MKTRSELKAEARKLLAGNWGKAILLNIISIVGVLLVGAFALGVITLIAVMAKHAAETGDSSVIDNYTSGGGSRGGGFVGGLISTFIGTGILYTLLDWLRTKNNDFSPVRGMFSIFSKEYFVPVLVLYILQTIFTFLWTLLFVIPGIIKSYAYSQTYFIYKDINASGNENHLNYLDYITLSRELMKGQKFEFFVLQLSFIGWWILGVCTFGVAFIWIIPYYQTTIAAYYKSLAGDKFLNYQAA